MSRRILGRPACRSLAKVDNTVAQGDYGGAAHGPHAEELCHPARRVAPGYPDEMGAISRFSGDSPMVRG